MVIFTVFLVFLLFYYITNFMIYNKLFIYFIKFITKVYFIQ